MANRAASDARGFEAHWLFKPRANGVTCLCILELADGDYWVIDSPTGTYLSGHADRGKWRAAEARYLADGYLRESEARTRGLIAPSWIRAVPDPTSLGRQHGLHVTILVFLIVTVLVVLVRIVPRLMTAIIRW